MKTKTATPSVRSAGRTARATTESFLPPSQDSGNPRPHRPSPPTSERSERAPAARLLGIANIDVGQDEPPEHLFRRLLGAYLAGAREFAVRERPTVSTGTRDVIRTFCRRTRQPEILSDEPGMILLRDLAFESPIPLHHRIARMGRMVSEFHREAVESWSQLPFLEDGYWQRRDDEIDREAWYVQRVAAIRLGVAEPASGSLGLWTTARSLERIADHAVVIGEAGRRLVDLPNGTGPATSLRQFHQQAMAHLEGVLVANDGGTANDLLDLGEALQASGRALADRLLPAVGGGTMPPATAAAVTRILESVNRTIAYSQDIAQVALDRWTPDSTTVGRVGTRPGAMEVSPPS